METFMLNPKEALTEVKWRIAVSIIDKLALKDLKFKNLWDQLKDVSENPQRYPNAEGVISIRLAALKNYLSEKFEVAL
jgi:hypothetical protein